MSEKVVWRAGNSPGEFMSNYRGWILIMQRQPHSGVIWWQWSVRRGALSTGSIADDRIAAENAAVKAVNLMEGKQ